MIPLIKLREDLRFSKELLEMIEVLKSATASQFRSLQNKRKGFEQFKLRLEEFLATLKTQKIVHPFLIERKNLPKAVVMVTSDEGFLGSLNALVLNAGLEQAAPGDELIVLGERGSRYLAETQREAFTFLPGIGDEITYERAIAVRDLLISKFLSKKIGSVLIAYPQFLSLTVQRVEVARLLPSGDLLVAKTGGIQRPGRRALEILLEPSRVSVVDYLVRAALMQKLYDVFLESKLSECAARIIHLEGSREEIVSVNKRLLYVYFKQLHEKSDKNIREIFASRLRWRESKREGFLKELGNEEFFH
jgi:ATP synthase F1 gamma subunit